MLHWTGGSRRKVTTSRKSTENRQKQYFEQKSRRQQTAHPQNFDSGIFRYVQQPKEHRSLDIQSLLNLSNIAAKRESAPTDGDACLKVPAGKPTNANILIDPVEHEGPGSSQNNAETVSPRMGVNKASNNQGKGSSGKMDHWNVFSEQNVSVLDLLDNEGIDRDSDFNQVNEDHVAFSIDDLGKTGKKTEDHLEWCPDRHFSYGFASPSKNTGYVDLSRNTSRAPYEPRHETGSIGKDFNEAFSPKPRASGSTFCRGNASSIPNQETVGLWDDVEYNIGYSSKNASGHKNSFSNIYDSNVDIWDAMTSTGENFFCERDFDVSRKHLGVDTMYNNNIHYGYPDVHASDNIHLPKKRASTMSGLGVNISEPPTQNFRQRTSGDGWCGTGNLMDDPSDGLSSMSEESCSSTYNSVLNTNSRQARDKHSTSFGRTGNTMHQSREHDRMLGQSNLNPFHNLQEKLSSDKNWSTGNGYSPFNTDSDFNSFYNPESSHFGLRKESPLTVFPEPDSSIDGQFLFDPSNNYESTKVSPSSRFFETHPHRTFKEMDSDSFTGFCKVESRIDDQDQPPRSHHVASFFEEISLKESGDGNVNCAMFEIRCFQEIHFNGKPCGASNCCWTQNDMTCKDSNELKDAISDMESNARPSGSNVETSSSTVLESNKKHEDMHDSAAETRIAILSDRVGKNDIEILHYLGCSSWQPLGGILTNQRLTSGRIPIKVNK